MCYFMLLCAFQTDVIRLVQLCSTKFVTMHLCPGVLLNSCMFNYLDLMKTAAGSRPITRVNYRSGPCRGEFLNH